MTASGCPNWRLVHVRSTKSRQEDKEKIAAAAEMHSVHSGFGADVIRGNLMGEHESRSAKKCKQTTAEHRQSRRLLYKMLRRLLTIRKHWQGRTINPFYEFTLNCSSECFTLKKCIRRMARAALKTEFFFAENSIDSSRGREESERCIKEHVHMILSLSSVINKLWTRREFRANSI